MLIRVEAVVGVDSEDIAVRDAVQEVACFDVEAPSTEHAEELVRRLLHEKNFDFLFLQSYAAEPTRVPVRVTRQQVVDAAWRKAKSGTKCAAWCKFRKLGKAGEYHLGPCER